MTDRELLEAAAKAAGYWSHEFNCPDKLPAGWDPLSDDGDALRLAVALRLNVAVKTLPHAVYVEAYSDQTPAASETLADVRFKVADEAAATRRAIVRAAAALSRAPGAE